MFKNIIKTIKKNKAAFMIITLLLIIIIVQNKDILKQKSMIIKNRVQKTVILGGASRDPQEGIIEIERAHKCNQAGCATRETKQKKHILL